MNLKLLATLCVIAIIVMSCSKNDDPRINDQFDFKKTIVHDSQDRTYHVHLPKNYYDQDQQLALVIALHGGGGSGDQFETQSGLTGKSDEAGFIVVYPDGAFNPNVRVRSWNAGKCCGANASALDTDDVGFISAIIDDVVGNYRVDSNRVYATGHSNGAMLCYRLADELSQKIAAIAPNAGNFQMDTPYDPSRNVPVLEIISKLDENVKYEGGMTNGPGGQYNPPIDSCLTVVASRGDCSSLKSLVDTFPLYSVYAWASCASPDFEVLLYLTEDGGHSWPGGNPGSSFGDEPSVAFSNNDVIWEFFQKHPLQ